MTMDDQKQISFCAFDGSACAGKAQSMTDRNGNIIRFTYDPQGRFSKITDTLNRDILVAYNADGFIATVRRRK